MGILKRNQKLPKVKTYNEKEVTGVNKTMVVGIGLLSFLGAFMGLKVNQFNSAYGLQEEIPIQEKLEKLDEVEEMEEAIAISVNDDEKKQQQESKRQNKVGDVKGKDGDKISDTKDGQNTYTITYNDKEYTAEADFNTVTEKDIVQKDDEIEQNTNRTSMHSETEKGSQGESIYVSESDLKEAQEILSGEKEEKTQEKIAEKDVSGKVMDFG